MIYLVSNNLSFNAEDITPMRVEDSIQMIGSWPVVQFDTETTGLDCHVCNMISMQFGYKNFNTGEYNQIVVDTKSIDPLLYRRIIEDSYLIGHNLKFDLKFLYNYGITPLNVYDTMICEQLLYLGYKPGMVSYSLHDVLFRYTGIDLNKLYQKKIASKGLTEEGVRYAAGDVIHLQDIRRHQVEISNDRKCVNALIVENRFVPAIAYLEWCGIHLDEDKWKAKMEKDRKNMETYRNQLDEYVVSHTGLNAKFTSTSTQLDLFVPEDISCSPHCNIDWDSPAQVIPVFQELGFNTWTTDKKTKKERDSVVEDVITNQKGIADDFVEIYYKYKEASKRVSAFGQTHLNQINPNTGRIHTSFKQFGTVTGRMSSGSKEGNADLARIKLLRPSNVTYCNLQQLPRDAETRSCFTAQDGNLFISCDFSSEESRVQANVWNEKKLLDAFEHGVDTHSLYAKMCFPEELKDIDVKDVKKLRPDLRQNAKYFEFELAYGGVGLESAKKLGLDPGVATKNVENILKEMPAMVAFKRKLGKFVAEHGYMVIHELTGHRIYWPEWAEWKAIKDRFDNNFWNDYMINHKGTGDHIDQMVKEYTKQKKTWLEKNVLNYPIQGGSAIVMKQAAADLFEWVVKNRLFGKILFCVFVHDELDVECPESMKDTFPKKLQSIMENAAKKYYKRLPVPADAEISKQWVH